MSPVAAKKISGENDGSSWCPFFVCQVIGYENVRWVSQNYYFSNLVWPAREIYSHSPQPQDFLDPQNSLAWQETMTKKNFEFASRRAKLNPLCFCYCRRAVDNTIIAYIVCCGNFSTFSGKYSRIVASSHTAESSWLRC